MVTQERKPFLLDDLVEQEQQSKYRTRRVRENTTADLVFLFENRYAVFKKEMFAVSLEPVGFEGDQYN